MMPAAPPLPEHALEEQFLAGTGPGGQNVNKVATAVQLRLDVRALGLAPDAIARLRQAAGRRWSDGFILLTARRFRTREANRADARERMSALVAAALMRPDRRVATRPTRASQLRRGETKARMAATKRGRARPDVD